MSKRRQQHRARQLRREQTEAELRLWFHLRGHRFQGLKFKRQKPVGPYIVDFICDACRLVIEVDGGQHNDDAERSYDQGRARYLLAQGLRVLRFWNDDVLKNTEAVLAQIWAAVQSAAPSPPTPLPRAGEGRMQTNV